MIFRAASQRHLRNFAVLTCLLVFSAGASFANSIIRNSSPNTLGPSLISSGGGEFDYEYLIPDGGFQLFQTGDSISLWGMSGVTGVLNAWGSTVSFTSSSVTMTYTGGLTLQIEGSFPLVRVLSLAPLGTVIYWVEALPEGVLTGTVGGPVAPPVPEPGTLVMFCSGVACLTGMVRRRSC